MPSEVSQGTFARCADEAAFLAALEADPVQELLPHGRMVAGADRGYHVTAIVAQVLDGPTGRDEPLVRDQAHKDEEEQPHHRADDPARQGEAFGLKGEGGP